ncbi:MAG: TonB-dependent receptor [Sphingobium sp.]
MIQCVSCRVLSALAIATVVAAAAPATAAPARPQREALGTALRQLALRGNASILFRPDLVAGRIAPATVAAGVPLEQGLTILLAGSGLRYRRVARNVFLIERQPARRGDVRPAPATGDDAERQVIVVTALRRPMLLGDTPASIVAITRRDVMRSGASDLAAIATLAPSLALTNLGAGLDRLSMRGVFGAGEASVGLYYGDTPVSGPSGSTSDPGFMTPNLLIADVDRVEVLRGPQGTLYGAGSLAGTVRILFAEPSPDRTEGEIDISAGFRSGGDPDLMTSAWVNMPVIADRLAARAVLYRRVRGGTIDNPALQGRDLDQRTDTGGRLALRLEDAGGWRLTLGAAYQHSRYEDAGQASLAAARDTTLRLVRLPFRGSFAMGWAALRGDTGFATLDLSLSRFRWTTRRTFNLTNVLLSQKGDRADCANLFQRAAPPCSDGELGAWDGYIDGHVPAILDQPLKVGATTAELRLSDSGRLSWTAGAFASRRRDEGSSAVRRTSGATGIALDEPGFAYRRFAGALDQFAVYADATWSLSDMLDVTGGGRLFRYRRRASGDTSLRNIITEPYDAPTMLSYRYGASGSAGRLRADYRPTEGMLVYGQFASGFRPGGINIIPGLDPRLAVYRDDRIGSLEAGTRLSLVDTALEVELVAYRQRWRDMQYAATSLNGAFALITNIGDARIKGLEMGVTARPTSTLTARLQATYADARLSSDQVTDLATTPGRAGDRLPYVAPWQISASVARVWSVSPGVRLRAEVTGHFLGRHYSAFRQDDPNNLAIGRTGAADMRITVEAGRWDAALFIENIGNTRGRLWASSGSFETGTVNRTPARTAGFSLTARF